MTESPLWAVGGAVYAALTTPSTALWTDVWPDRAKAGEARPLVVYFTISSIDDNRLRSVDDQTVTLGVKCLADSREDAMLGAAEIHARLNDMGHTRPSNTLDAGPDWIVLSATRTRIIDAPEYFSEALPIYHIGGAYQIVMEAI